jgi:NTE family protein
MGDYGIALALGGGGVRCMAHTGVIRALYENGLEPDIVVGSSVGSVFGGVYAYVKNPDSLDRFADNFSNNIMMKRLENALKRRSGGVLSKAAGKASYFFYVLYASMCQGVFSEHLMKKAYSNILGKGILLNHKFMIENTGIPFSALTTDYNSAEAVAITKGEMPTFLYASCAFPGLCKPVSFNGRALMDGGVVSNIPVMAAHLLGARNIIAVDTEQHLAAPVYKNAFQSINVATEIRGYRWNIVEKELADIVITPDIKHYRFYEFSKARTCREEGYSAASASMDAIKELFNKKESTSMKHERRTHMEQLYPFAVI